MGIFGKKRSSRAADGDVSDILDILMPPSNDPADWASASQATPEAFKDDALVPQDVMRLWETGDVASLLLILADTSQPGLHRRWAAEALSRLGDPTAVPELVAVLPDLEVRGYVAMALAMIGDMRAVGPLRMQHSENPMVAAKLKAAMDAFYTRDAAGTDAALKQYDTVLKDAAHRFGRQWRGFIDEHPRCPICDGDFRARLEHSVWCRNCNLYISEEAWWPEVACSGARFAQLLSERRYGFLASTPMFASFGFTDRDGLAVSSMPPPVCLVFRMHEDYRIPEGCSVSPWTSFMEQVAVSWNQSGAERDRRLEADLDL